MKENTSKCRERKRERERERERKRKGEREKERDRDEKLYGRMTKRSKRAEAGVIQNGPGGSQEYPKHSKQNAVIRSAAALRAPLTSLQNVNKNPRTLPNICQKVIK